MSRMRRLFTNMAVLVSLLLVPVVVHATGGAFPFTKHGGGTTDGETPYNAGNGAGVDRSVNPLFSIYYNNVMNGGKYRGGECNHCHEAHASFGGFEPPPNASTGGDAGGGPNPYLVLSDANPNACWFCHEYLANISGSGSPVGYGRYSFYQGKAYYERSGHYNNTTMKSPGYGPGSPWPRKDRTTTATSGHCINCHTPHGIMESPGGEYDTWAVPSSKHLSANNPDVSKDYLIPRQLIAWEEALCESCHRTVGEGGLIQAGDIRTQVAKLDGAYGIKGSGHPVHDVDQTGDITGANNSGTTFSGRHSLKNEERPVAGWNSYPDTRHVECVDCHNPHTAQGGTVFQPSGTTATNPNRVTGPAGIYAGGSNKGVWGVEVNTETGTVTGRVDDRSTPVQAYSNLYLYQLCLKCHSTFADTSLTSQPAPSWTNRTRWDTGIGDGYYFSFGDSEPMYLTDVAKDFALETGVYNPPKGYHPVFAPGRNQPPASANCRWNTLSINSTGCSPLSGSEESPGRPTGVRDTTIGFANTFVPPWGPDKMITCVDCHESENESDPRGPHGSAQPFILRKLDTSIKYTIQDDGYSGNGTGPYTVSYSNFDQGWLNDGSNSYGVKSINLGQWDPNNFCLNCHRADVYGFLDMGRTGAGKWTTGDRRWPRYRYLSRQPHPADGGKNGKGYSFASALSHHKAGDPPRGIVCLRCHGGGTVGGIHGNAGAPGFAYDTSLVSPSSNRLINGSAWTGIRFSSTSQAGSCSKNGGFGNYNSCTHSKGGLFDTPATYDY